MRQMVLVVTLLVAMVNPSFALNVANPATRRLIVPQGRRGMLVLRMGQLVALRSPLTPRKRTMLVPNPGSNKYKSKSEALVTNHVKLSTLKGNLKNTIAM